MDKIVSSMLVGFADDYHMHAVSCSRKNVSLAAYFPKSWIIFCMLSLFVPWIAISTHVCSWGQAICSCHIG